MPQLVLIHPQIPPNTGNIARTCAATGTELHLVGPLGFEISDRYLKRAGLDYWPYVNLHCHEDLAAFGGLSAAARGTSDRIQHWGAMQLRAIPISAQRLADVWLGNCRHSPIRLRCLRRHSFYSYEPAWSQEFEPLRQCRCRFI
jgi:hypothetical protein